MRLTHEEIEERVKARSDEFKAGIINENIYRACLFALRYRGEDINVLVRENWPSPRHANENAR